MNDLGNHSAMWVFGGAGHDEIADGDLADLLYGGAGHDEIAGGDLADLLYGGPGHDALSGRAGNDTIYGEEGEDELEGHDGNDTMEGGAGNDRLEGWGDGDYLYGGPGDDVIVGGQISQGMGTDHDDAADHIYGGDGNDWIDGRFGNDTIYGDGENVYGGLPGTEPGNDEIYGYDGYDYIYGGDGHDDLFGEEDGAYIEAGDGDDIVNDDPPPGYPQIDLVADVNENNILETEYGSPDNREENGFFGGMFIYLGQTRKELQILIQHNTVNLTGYGLRLENSSSVALQLWTLETGGTQVSTPIEWTIGDPNLPSELYMEGMQSGGGELRLTVLDPVTGEPVTDRPLADHLRFVVTAP